MLIFMQPKISVQKDTLRMTEKKGSLSACQSPPFLFYLIESHWSYLAKIGTECILLMEIISKSIFEPLWRISLFALPLSLFYAQTYIHNMGQLSWILVGFRSFHFLHPISLTLFLEQEQTIKKDSVWTWSTSSWWMSFIRQTTRWLPVIRLLTKISNSKWGSKFRGIACLKMKTISPEAFKK